jgi:tRNA A37 N6-isopentenylltransferase MiaA
MSKTHTLLEDLGPIVIHTLLEELSPNIKNFITREQTKRPIDAMEAIRREGEKLARKREQALNAAGRDTLNKLAMKISRYELSKNSSPGGSSVGGL